MNQNKSFDQVLYLLSSIFLIYFYILPLIIIEYIIRIIYSSDISRKATIGQGMIFQHGMNIVIGSSVKIGVNCKIMNGVILGNKDTEVNFNAQPIIGNNVVIGTGAKVLGNIYIDNNVRIGANSVVLKSFKSNSVVAGVPAKLIKKI